LIELPPPAFAQSGLDPCWSQTHYVGFLMARLIYLFSSYSGGGRRQVLLHVLLQTLMDT
jgi:hypothetical protein